MRLSRSHIALIAGVLVIPILLVLIPAFLTLDGTDLLIAVAITVLTMLIGVLVCSMRVDILESDTELKLKLFPFFSADVEKTQIVAMRPADTTIAQGFGYRILGRGRRGLLVGGPAIEIETPEKTWVVSCPNPDQVIEDLQAPPPGSTAQH